MLLKDEQVEKLKGELIVAIDECEKQIERRRGNFTDQAITFVVTKEGEIKAYRRMLKRLTSYIGANKR